MYQASSAFHYAVEHDAHQIALLIFNDAVFTNANIDVVSGIEFNDLFNAEKDIAIGQATSNELKFKVFNENGMLDEYEFGDFLATIGAQISTSTVTANGIVQANSGSHTYVAYNSSPYLKRDGVSVSSQPTEKIVSILIYNGNVYCLLSGGAVIGYKDSTGERDDSITLNEFMASQLIKWTGKGIHYANKILKIWEGTKLKTYEFVPLGWFTAKRPNVPTVHTISFTCYDFMQKFEIDMPTAADMNITYPISFGGLFEAMCDYVGVSYRTSTFINSTAVIQSEPEDFATVSMRDVLSWIAEAAASNICFDRDGYLVMDWIKDTDIEIDEHMYKEFQPYWYETATIKGVVNRASNGEYNNQVGVGFSTEKYLIQDNPLLRGVE